MKVINLADNSQDSDDARLVELGYVQRLNRRFGFWSAFGLVFAVLSPLTGFSPLFGYTLGIGGPIVILVSWAIVSFFTLCVALSMAEIVSHAPSSGGPFLWAASLTRNKSYGPFVSFLTGNLNLMGQVTFTALINYGNSQLILSIMEIRDPDFAGTAGQAIGIVAIITLLQVLINLGGIDILRIFSIFSVVLNGVGVPILSVLLLFEARSNQDPILSEFYDITGWTDFTGNKAYTTIIGLLASQFILVGYDANSHLAEETKNVSSVAPRALIWAILASILTGFLLMIGVLRSTSSAQLVQFVRQDTGIPIFEIFSQVFSRKIATLIFVFTITTTFTCGTFAMLTNSRMMYGFARDGGIPGYFEHVNPKSKLPQRTILLAAFLSFLVSFTAYETTLFTTVTSGATISLCLSYGIPILLTLIVPKEDFGRGLFSLHSFSKPLAVISVIWISFIFYRNITAASFNYSAPAIVLVLLATFTFYSFTKRRWNRKQAERSTRRKNLHRISVISETVTVVESDEMCFELKVKHLV